MQSEWPVKRPSATRIDFPKRLTVDARQETSLLSFEHGQQWQVIGSSQGPSSSALLLELHAGESLCGRMHVICVAKKQAEQSGRQMLVELIKRTCSFGLRHTGSTISPVSPPSGFDHGEVCIVTVTGECANAEMSVFAFDSEKHHLLLSVFGPTRRNSPIWWAVNKRAVEVFTSTVRIEAA